MSSKKETKYPNPNSKYQLNFQELLTRESYSSTVTHKQQFSQA